MKSVKHITPLKSIEYGSPKKKEFETTRSLFHKLNHNINNEHSEFYYKEQLLEKH